MVGEMVRDTDAGTERAEWVVLLHVRTGMMLYSLQTRIVFIASSCTCLPPHRAQEQKDM